MPIPDLLELSYMDISGWKPGAKTAVFEIAKEKGITLEGKERINHKGEVVGRGFEYSPLNIGPVLHELELKFPEYWKTDNSPDQS